MKPPDYIEAMITKWYTRASAFLARDPEQGRLWDDAGFWDSEHSATQHIEANLGLFSMLLTAETWQTPKNPKLQSCTLAVNSAIAIIYAAWSISFTVDYKECRPAHMILSPKIAVARFVQSTWQVARAGYALHSGGPGVEAGAHDDEFRISDDGREIITSMCDEDEDEDEWVPLAYWHPVKETLGNPWNKFFRNIQQPVFRVTPPDDAAQGHDNHETSTFAYRMPSSAIDLADIFESQYDEWRHRMDTVS